MPPSSAAVLVATFLNCFHNYPTNSTAGEVVLPESPSFTLLLDSRVRNLRYNTTATPKPLLIINPGHYSHVQASVVCARSLIPSYVQLRVRSGGHDYEGATYASRDGSAPFFVLDLGGFDSVDVYAAQGTAWVESGATLGELYYRTAEATGGSRGFPAGICTGVGVGGHVTGGGYGNMIRRYGLSSDNVVDIRLVNVNGSVIDRSSMGEDLFWAVLGGGGASFGVILAYKLKLVSVPEIVTVFRVARMVDDENGTEVVYRWQFVAPAVDNGLFMRVLVQPVMIEGSTRIKVSVLAMFLGGKESLVETLSKEFPELGLGIKDCIEMSWIRSVLWWDGIGNDTAPEVLLSKSPNSAKFLKRKSDYVVEPIPREGFDGLWKEMTELEKVGLVFNPYGGRMNEILATDTPFPHRAGNLFKIQYSITWSEIGVDAQQEHLGKIQRLYDYMTPFVSKNPRRAYFNYKDFNIGVTGGKGNIYDEGRVYGVKYFGQNFKRLVEVKTRVDPENFFRNEQSIPPLPRSVSSAGPGSTTAEASVNLGGAVAFFFVLELVTSMVYIF